MGSWVRNWAVADAASGAVQEKLVGWLERKGFELRATAPLAKGPEQEEPTVFLLTRGRWSIVVYSRSFDEGDRLRRELDSFPVWMELWIADSDAWGYTLFERHEATAMFASRSEFAPEAFADSEANGGVERVCEVLGLSPQLGELRRIERQRGIFADSAFDRFCAVLGIEASNLTANDLWDACAARSGDLELRGWNVRALWFQRARNGSAQEHQPRLHRQTFRQPETAKGERSVEEFIGSPKPAGLTATLTLMRVFGFAFRVFGFVLGPLLRWRMRRQSPEASIAGALFETKAGFELHEGWLVNSRHGCRVRPASETAEAEPIAAFGNVFVQRHGELTLNCVALRSEQLRPWFNLHPGYELVTDTSFQVGALAARHSHIRQSVGDQVGHVYSWFIEKPDADGTIYHFQCYTRTDPLSETDFARFESSVRSFEFLPAGTATTAPPG